MIAFLKTMIDRLRGPRECEHDWWQIGFNMEGLVSLEECAVCGDVRLISREPEKDS